MRSLRTHAFRRITIVIAALGVLVAPPVALARNVPAPNASGAGNASLAAPMVVQFRELRVQVAGQNLPDRVYAFQSGYQVLLPLADIARLLKLDIQVRADHGHASGTLPGDGGRFALDLNQSQVMVGGHLQSFEPRLAMVIDGDIYVSTQMLARWLPIELAVDLPKWQLRLQRSEPRPAQARAATPEAPLPSPIPSPPAEPTIQARQSTVRTPVRRASDIEANLLVLEVQLDGQVLSDSFSAYQDGQQILLPLGELARLLTLSIQVRPDTGSAAGSVIKEDRSFALNLGDSLVTLSGREQGFEPRLATVIGDDIYVSSQLLSHWLPLDLKIDLASLQLKVKPREKLPLQERLERERMAANLNGMQGAERPNYPYTPSTPALIGVPFIDQSFGADARFGRNAEQYKAAYTAYLTGDLLGMEGAAYVLKTDDKTTPDLRMSLSRHDPDGGLLGPLHARAVTLGNVVLPSVRNIMTGSPKGNGVAVSNRPLDQPNSFDRHSLRGDLPPGWDVTLYYNNSLVAFQSSRADGQYAFDDLPLSIGPNEFRLVFHGPLGQLRAERQSFLLDQASVKPGELYYSIAQQYADDGTTRSVAQVDVGLTQHLTGNLGVIRRPQLGTQTPLNFGQVGLQAYMNSMILSSMFTGMQGGGTLGELALKTRLGGFTADLTHTQRVGHYLNDQYSDVAGGARLRDELHFNGTVKASGLPAVILDLDTQRNIFPDTNNNYLVGLRASTMLRGTAFSNSLRWQRTGDLNTTDGVLQVSRRVADIGLNGQLAYKLRPGASVQALALNVDHNIADGYQISGGLLRTMDTQTTLASAGFSKNFGSFGLAMTASYSNQRETAVGMQLFVALDRDPRTGKWSLDGMPLAGMGAISARAFVDRNMNGLHDPGEDWVPNAGFILNGGGRHPTLTNADGTAMLTRLSPGRYADVALDPTTLEDPQWKPLTPGVRVLPRPGRVESLEFPVVPTSEVEGTVYLVEKGGKRRGIGDARIELVDAKGKVVATTTSSADGYYLFHQVLPGHQRVRVAPDQAVKLKLDGSLELAIEVPDDGNFISGQDLLLKLAAR
ncbi:MAG TPA: hypothetical protein VGM81_19980 [Burkholderiaceae bacterium]|jgi:hypothetical protein